MRKYIAILSIGYHIPVFFFNLNEYYVLTGIAFGGSITLFYEERRLTNSSPKTEDET